MNRLDRLIIKAKKKQGCDRLILGMVSESEEEPGKWIARADIWNGKKGSGVRSLNEPCDSIDEAVDKLHMLSCAFPNNKDIVIIVDDLSE